MLRYSPVPIIFLRLNCHPKIHGELSSCILYLFGVAENNPMPDLHRKVDQEVPTIFAPKICVDST